MNFLMDGFSSESYFSLDNALEHGTSMEANEQEQTRSSPAVVAQVPDPDVHLVDTDWTNQFKEIDSLDLIDSPDPFGIKNLARYIFDQPDQQTTVINMYANTATNDFNEAAPASFSALVPVKQEEVQAEVAPKIRRGRRPKAISAHDSNASLVSTTGSMDLQDIKPEIPSTSSFKRAFDDETDTNMSTISISTRGKRMKKYMENSEDPAVKNAKAAKLNREKKKREVEALKAELQVSRKQIEELRSMVAQTTQQMAEMKRENETVRAKYLASNGLRGVAPSIRDFLTSIIPPLQETYGRFNVEFSEVFDEVSTLPSLPGQENTLENSSQVFTTQVDMNSRRILVDYDPCFGGVDNRSN